MGQLGHGPQRAQGPDGARLASGDRRRVAQQLLRRIAQGLDAQRRIAVDPGEQGLVLPVHQPPAQSLQHRVLVLEIAIEGRRGHAGAGADQIGGDPLDAHLAQQFAGDVQQPLIGLQRPLLPRRGSAAGGLGSG